MPTESPLVPGTTHAPAAQAAAPAELAAAPAPSDLPQTTEQLAARMERHTRAHMRKLLGTDDSDAIRAKFEQAATMEAAETERKRAALTEMERITGDLTSERARSAELQATLSRVQNEAAITTLCAGMGMKNVSYALYEAGQAKAPEGGKADYEAHFRALLARPESRAALGFEAPATVAPVGVSTIPGIPSGVVVTPPPAGGSPTPMQDVNTMTPAQFQAHLSALGV